MSARRAARLKGLRAWSIVGICAWRGPSLTSSSIVRPVHAVNLIFIVPLLEEDLRVSYVWWSNARSGPQDPETKRLMKKGGHALWMLWRRDLLMLLAWMRSHNMYVKFLGWAFAILASVMLLLMRTCSDHYWATNFPDFVDASDKTDILRIPLSLASFLHGLAFFSALLFQFEKLGIFYKTVFQMLASDVFNWMILFFIFLFNYGIVMWISCTPASTRVVCSSEPCACERVAATPRPPGRSLLGCVRSRACAWPPGSLVDLSLPLVVGTQTLSSFPRRTPSYKPRPNESQQS